MDKAAPPEEDPAGAEVMLVKELSSKRASVDHYRAECERLRKINHKLKQEMFEREKANFEVIDHWRLEVDKKDQVIEKQRRAARALQRTIVEIAALKAELGIQDNTPQEEFDAFLEQSKQLTPRALRAAEREFMESEKLEEERDYLSFLKSSGQVPAEHPPAAEFDAFLEESKQLTPKALRAAEWEFEASEEVEDY
eukprot:COSAG04_NODE_12225_length_664_cov_0.794690_1_plen_195_part_10